MCATPITMTYLGMDPEEKMESLRTTDLSETCGYVYLLDIYIEKSTNTNATTAAFVEIVNPERVFHFYSPGVATCR